MYFLGLGVVLLLLKYLEIGPLADWSWWWMLTPFALDRALVDLGRCFGLHQAQGHGD